MLKYLFSLYVIREKHRWKRLNCYKIMVVILGGHHFLHKKCFFDHELIKQVLNATLLSLYFRRMHIENFAYSICLIFWFLIDIKTRREYFLKITNYSSNDFWLPCFPRAILTIFFRKANNKLIFFFICT